MADTDKSITDYALENVDLVKQLEIVNNKIKEYETKISDFETTVKNKDTDITRLQSKLYTLTSTDKVESVKETVKNFNDDYVKVCESLKVKK